MSPLSTLRFMAGDAIGITDLQGIVIRGLEDTFDEFFAVAYLRIVFGYAVEEFPVHRVVGFR